MSQKLSIAFMLCLLLNIVFCLSTIETPTTDLDAHLNALVSNRSLKGLQIQITKGGSSIYEKNIGQKNQRNESIDSNTVFRIASCSKSFSSVGIMLLVQQGKLKLNDTVSKILGFEVKNPNFPDIPITVEILLSHQSSIAQTQTEYTNFLMDTYNAKDGYSIPALKEILSPGGKYYNPKMFYSDHKPGEYYHYSNLGYFTSGAIIQKISGQRFDIYQQQNILNALSQGLVESATYDASKVKDYKNLGALYVGSNGKWTPDYDNYNSQIPSRNLTGYIIGSNGGMYGPQGGLRASVRHMNNYMYMLANKGIMKNGKRLLTEASVNEIIRPRYQYNGASSGPALNIHLYGFAIYTSSYFECDNVIQHEVTRGHLGSAYGLISGYFYWKDYTFSYIINGALNGYSYSAKDYFEGQRIILHKGVSNFIVANQQYLEQSNQVGNIIKQQILMKIQQ